jgi:hypothetical protein
MQKRTRSTELVSNRSGFEPLDMMTYRIRKPKHRVSQVLGHHGNRQRSPEVSAVTLLNAVVQELIAIDHDRFNLFKAYTSSVESPCTVDSTLSNLRLLPWHDIGIVSTLPSTSYYGLYPHPGLYT